jgi:DNA modification methylase
MPNRHDVRLIPVRKLKRNPHNPRTHPNKQVRQIVESVRRFGWTYPLLVAEDGTILAGHGRYEAALQLRLREVPAITISGLSETEKRALVLADNKIAANAGWDRALLAAELGELAHLLPECELSIEITGFEPAEIDSLLVDFVDPEEDPADDVTSVVGPPVSRRGFVWSLGQHRLLCGDAKSASDLRKLMGSERAAMAFEDAPYNLPARTIQGRGRIRHGDFLEASGEMSPDAFISFLTTIFGLVANYLIDGSLAFTCMDWRHLAELLTAGRNANYSLENLVVWVKSNAGQGSLYRSQHELIGVFKKGRAAHRNNIELGRHGRNRSNVWHYAGVNSFRAGRLVDLAAHPTVKPVRLVADAMLDVTARGDVVLDPFMGSGTTILAAEKVGRRGFGLEIDPTYVDTAVRRWQSFTRRDAVLAGTEKTFDEIAAETVTPNRSGAR